LEVTKKTCGGLEQFDIEESKNIIPPEIAGRAEDGLEKFVNLLADLNAAVSHRSGWRWIYWSQVILLVIIPALIPVHMLIASALRANDWTVCIFGSIVVLVLGYIPVVAFCVVYGRRTTTVEKKLRDIIQNFNRNNSAILGVNLEWFDGTRIDNRGKRYIDGACGFTIVDLRAGAQYLVPGQQWIPGYQQAMIVPMQDNVATLQPQGSPMFLPGQPEATMRATAMSIATALPQTYDAMPSTAQTDLPPSYEAASKGTTF